MRVLVLFCVLLFSVAFAQDVSIRVLVSQQNKMQLVIPFAHYVLGPDGTVLYQGSSPVQWSLQVKEGRIEINGQDSGRTTLHFQETTQQQALLLNGIRYRGAMSLHVSGSGLMAVNTLNIEDYLRSVVPAEMPASWPLEALKAQAIIARTYAIARINPKSVYDLCATEQCQVYKGQGSEHPLVDVAIAQTRRQIIAYGPQPAKTFFSSDNGGYTASSAEVWGGNLPYLVAQPDPFSVGPRSNWTLNVPLATLSSKARAYGLKGNATGMRIDQYSPSGRVAQVTVLSDTRDLVLKGAEAGGIIHTLGGYSTRVVVQNQDGLVLVHGSGNGHGVGLSQYGAKNMAEKGYSTDQILGFYYPGVSRGGYVLADAQPAPKSEPDLQKALMAAHPLSSN